MIRSYGYFDELVSHQPFVMYGGARVLFHDVSGVAVEIRFRLALFDWALSADRFGGRFPF